MHLRECDPAQKVTDNGGQLFLERPAQHRRIKGTATAPTNGGCPVISCFHHRSTVTRGTGGTSPDILRADGQFRRCRLLLMRAHVTQPGQRSGNALVTYPLAHGRDFNRCRRSWGIFRLSPIPPWQSSHAIEFVWTNELTLPCANRYRSKD